MKSPQLKLILSCTFVLCSFPALAEITFDSPILDKYALSIQENRFDFDEGGSLIKGPTRSPGQPIDFSSILKEAYIKGGFFNSITGCFPEIDYCRSEVRRFDNRTLKLNFVIGSASSEVIGAAEIHVVAEQSIGVLGFEFAETPEREVANITVFVGSTEFIRRQAIEKSDNFVLQSLEHWEKNEGDHSFIGKLLAKPETHPFCYVSTKNWLPEESLEIYANIAGVSACLPQSYFTAIGLYPTLFDTPSLGNWSMEYTSPTFADRLYTNILYNEGFPLGQTTEEMQDFWSQNAARFWRNAIEDDLGEK